MKYIFLSIYFVLISLWACDSQIDLEINQVNKALIENGLENQNVILQQWTERNIQDYIETYQIFGNFTHTIITNQGSFISIPPNTFIDCENLVISNNSITINIIEAKTYIDLLRLNLTTRSSENRLLKSVGMIYIQAYDSNGKTLTLVEGKEIDIILQSENLEENIELYKGNKVEDEVKWTLLPENQVMTNVANDDIISGVPTTSTESGTTVPVIFPDERNTINGYQFNILQLGWFACIDNIFQDESNMDTMEFELEESHNENNKSIIYVLMQSNTLSMIKARWNFTTDKFATQTAIPVDEPLKIFALSILNEKHFGFNLNTTHQKSIEVLFQNIAPSTIDQYLQFNSL